MLENYIAEYLRGSYLTFIAIIYINYLHCFKHFFQQISILSIKRSSLCKLCQLTKFLDFHLRTVFDRCYLLTSEESYIISFWFIELSWLWFKIRRRIHSLKQDKCILTRLLCTLWPVVSKSILILGTMGFEDATGNIPPGRGTLYKLNDTGCFQNLDPVLPGVSVSNGIAWNKDGTKMYYIDSPTKQIALFDYDPATTSICNFVIFFFDSHHLHLINYLLNTNYSEP